MQLYKPIKLLLPEVNHNVRFTTISEFDGKAKAINSSAYNNIEDLESGTSQSYERLAGLVENR